MLWKPLKKLSGYATELYGILECREQHFSVHTNVRFEGSASYNLGRGQSKHKQQEVFLEYSCNKCSNLIGQLEVHYFTYRPPERSYK